MINLLSLIIYEQYEEGRYLLISLDDDTLSAEHADSG